LQTPFHGVTPEVIALEGGPIDPFSILCDAVTVFNDIDEREGEIKRQADDPARDLPAGEAAPQGGQLGAQGVLPGVVR
jgi:hypothetical protein